MADPRTLANLVEARARTGSGFDTYRGTLTERPTRGYVSLYFGGGNRFADTLIGTADSLGWSFRAICVGLSDDQCLYVLGKVRALFLNWRPLSDPSAGWFTEPPDDPPLLKDDTVANDVRYSISPRFTITTRST